jgi:hypothetical protein
MPLQLWIGQGGYFFMDTFLDCPIQVGQAGQPRADGPWMVEVNGSFLTAPDLESAKLLFGEKYDRSLVALSPMSIGDDPEEDAAEGFTIVDLTPLQESIGRVQREMK